MKYMVLLGAFWTIFAISVAESLPPLDGYIFTSARTLITGENNELHFRRIGNFDQGELIVKVTGYDSGNITVAADETFQIPGDEPDVTLHLFVKTFVYNAKLEIKGTFGQDVISGNDSVTLSSPKKSIFIIQTDKHLYQPGQTVKFRLLRVNKALKPYQDNDKANVYVEDAKGIRLFEFNNIDLSKGLVQYMFPLSDEPAKGSWTISASTKDTTMSADFEVKDYVLPKFDVNIIFPPYVLANEEFIPIKICANYTYGKPVVGSLELNISLQYYNYYRRYPYDKQPLLQESVEIDGCYYYLVNVSWIEEDDRYTGQGIKVVANVTEKGTGVEKVITQSINRQTNPLNLKFSDGQRQNYKPGLPFNGKLQVSNPDNTPAESEPIEICATIVKSRIIVDWWSTKTLKYCRNYVSDDKGNIPFTIVADNVDVISIDIGAKSLKYVSNTSGGRKNALTQPQASTYISPFFSPSGSFIQIQPVRQPVPCGTKQTFKVLFTAKENGNLKFYYQVTRQNNLIEVGTKEKYFSKQDDVSRVYENDKRLVNAKMTQIVPSPEELKHVPSDQKNCPSAKNARYLPPIGEINIDIDIDSPEFYLLVYYVRDDRETVADSQRINVEQCFKNKVDFAFRDTALQPSQTTKVQIRASPNSLCGIKAIDKSLALLDNSDQLNKDNVFQKLHSLDSNQYGSSNPCGNNHIQPGLAERYRNIVIPAPPGFRSNSYEDALTSFQTSGLLVISDFLIFTRPCTSPVDNYRPLPYYENNNFARFEKRAMLPMGAGLDGGFISTPSSFMPPPSPDVPRGSTSSVKAVRDYFPETWLFELEMTGSDGTFAANKQLPDTVTEWIGNAVCVNSEDGLGISNTTSITALQAFFIDYTLPVSVIRGEQFVLIVSVFSYADGPLPITVTLAHSESFEVTSDSIDGDYCLEPDTSVNLNITLKATKIGKVNITVLAETANNKGICRNSASNDYARDAITKPITVEAEGFPEEDVINSLVCPSDRQEHIDQSKITLTLPNDVVPDSARAYMDFSGNVMGKVLDNLDNLVSLPTGCGEQNMVKFNPNYLALDYLTSIKKLNDDFKNKAISNLNSGYQRELNYRRDDGSFSAFGQVDKEGSMFLTAFVLRSFYEAKRYIFISENILNDMQKWITDRQNPNGCFQNSGHILDLGLEGGLDKDNSSGSITAYVLASLIISNFKDEKIKENAFSCLANNRPLNPYSQLLYAYTYALAGKNEQAIRFIGEAKQRINNKDGMVSFIIVGGTEAIANEAVAYAVLSTFAVGGKASDVLPYIRYLTKHFNSYGGFRSTQDTCVGIAALAEFAKPIFKDPLNVSIKTTGSLQNIVEINDRNKLLVQRFKVSYVPSEVYIDARGTGCGLIQASIRYNTILPPEKRMFSIEVNGECSFSGCEHATMNVLVSYLPSDQKSGMSLVEIKLISGFVADRANLNQLKSGNENILRIDVQNNMVIFYFSEFSNTVTDFSFQVLQVVNVIDAKPGTAKVYDYYAPENSASASYIIRGFNSDVNPIKEDENSMFTFTV